MSSPAYKHQFIRIWQGYMQVNPARKDQVTRQWVVYVTEAGKMFPEHHDTGQYWAERWFWNYLHGHDGGFPGGYVPPYLPPPKAKPASRSTAKTPGNTRNNTPRAETASGIKKESESTAGGSARVVGTEAMAKPAQTELPTRELKRRQSVLSDNAEGFGGNSKKQKVMDDERGETGDQGQSRISSGYIPGVIKKLWYGRKSSVSSLGGPEGTKQAASPESSTPRGREKIDRKDPEDSTAGAKVLNMIKAAIAEDPALYEELIEGFADIARAAIIGKLSSLEPQS